MSAPEPASTAVRHVLFDADGVLQVVPGGDWYTLVEPYVGARAREFLHRAWALERPTLAGVGQFLPLLAGLLGEYGVTASADEVFAAAWCRLETVPETLAVARALRRNGYGVHLGTNQDAGRAAYLRAEFGYDDLFDTSCYSCELGVAKPDPAFFVEAARRIGGQPHEILFVDDTAANVDAATAAGLVAFRWTVDDGHDALRDELARHGLDTRAAVAASRGGRRALTASGRRPGPGHVRRAAHGAAEADHEQSAVFVNWVELDDDHWTGTWQRGQESRGTDGPRDVVIAWALDQEADRRWIFDAVENGYVPLDPARA